jgi:predicted AlkP superfamily pyrophosphatase or phosphodiesterase
VSVGAPISANIPQYWRAGTADDRKLVRALSSPGLLDRLEQDLGPYADGADESIGGDETRGRFAVRIVESERPAFLTAYFTALDHEQHEHGPLGPRNPAAMRVLERIDAIVGRLTEAARRAGGPDAVVAVVSDHGFAPASLELNLLPALHDAGLLDIDSTGRITAWRASIWAAGGTVAVVAKDPANLASRQRLRDVIHRLAADAAFGIARVVEPSELVARGAFPSAELVLALRPGVTSGTQVISTVIRKASVLGMHGYWPDVPEMRSAFFITGRGVPRGTALGEIDMRSIGPTLASLLGVVLSGAEGEPLLARVEAR